jgi:hypothetical protein
MVRSAGLGREGHTHVSYFAKVGKAKFGDRKRWGQCVLWDGWRPLIPVIFYNFRYLTIGLLGIFLYFLLKIKGQ